MEYTIRDNGREYTVFVVQPQGVKPLVDIQMIGACVHTLEALRSACLAVYGHFKQLTSGGDEWPKST